MLSCCSTLCNTRIYVICVLMTLSLLRGRSRVRSTSQVQAIPERRVITRAMDLPPSYLKHLNQALMKLPQEKRQELFDTYERAQGILVSAIDSHVVALPLRMQPHFGERSWMDDPGYLTSSITGCGRLATSSGTVTMSTSSSITRTTRPL
jgi:hypothetical protein